MDNYYKICPVKISDQLPKFARVPSNCGCPAMMSDGKIYTEYRNAKRVDEYIKDLNGIDRDDEFRMMLQQNAQKMLNNEWNYLKNNNSCSSTICVHNYPTRVDQATFVEEMKNYNNRYGGVSKCSKLDDIRMN